MGAVILRQITSPAGANSKLVREMARVFRQAREARLSFSLVLHSEAEDRRFLSGDVLPKNSVWVAEVNSSVIAFIAFSKGWIHHLFVAPEFQHQGVGSRLTDLAKASAPHLQLWVFQTNVPAIRFYKRHGFQVTRQTDGASNEERMPDVLMEWPSGNP
jgi:ribosomal protein S18 acetylase RimI-like enzyme